MSRFHTRLINKKKWARIRLTVLESAHYECHECGGFSNECHHVAPLNRGGAAYDLDNLRAYCVDCHKEITRRDNSNPRPPGAELWDEYIKELEHNAAAVRT